MVFVLAEKQRKLLKFNIMNNKINHSIWMLSNTIQRLTNVVDYKNEISYEWLKLAMENLEETKEFLEREFPQPF